MSQVRHRNHVPIRNQGKIFPPKEAPSFGAGLLAQVKKVQYLEHAWDVSYIMQGKSTLDSALDWFDQFRNGAGGQKPRRVQSFLGGAFLRMYLAHKVDSDSMPAPRARAHSFPVHERECLQLRPTHRGDSA
jgi:hypothetical protein